MMMFKKRILLVAILLGSGGVWAQQDAKNSGRTVLSSPGGRYVFGQVSDYRRDQYMLDTQTGRVWRIVQVTYKKEDGTEGTYEMLDGIPYDQKGLYTLPPPVPAK